MSQIDQNNATQSTPERTQQGSRAHRKLIELKDGLRQLVMSEADLAKLQRGILRQVLQHPTIVGGAWYARDANGEWRPGIHELEGIALEDQRVRESLEAAVETTATDVRRRIYATGVIRNLQIVTQPIHTTDEQATVLALLVANAVSDCATELMIAEVIAACVTMHNGRDQVERLAWELQSTAVALELVGQVSEHESVSHACASIANELRDYLKCEAVVVTTRRANSSEIRALSSVSELDLASQGSSVIRKACDEVLQRQELTCWPPLSDVPRSGSLAHKQLTKELQVESAVTVPLRDPSKEIVGTLTVAGTIGLAGNVRTQALVSALEEPLGSAIRVSSRLEGGRWQRLARSLDPFAHSGRAILLGAAAIMIASLLMTPFPYRVRCHCHVEPVQRRFAVAPYDGLVETTLVEPGNMVETGQVLARMDGREIRWELAGVTADAHRAQKKRDSHMARHEIPDSVMAGLEVERLETRTELLRFREDHLQVKSPINGIVLSGSLDKRENYPVKLGDSLYEIAPIDEMRIELEVPADDVHHVREGLNVSIRIDGQTASTLTGTVARLHPRSVVRESDNVFIADVIVPNDKRALRPGMHGTATVTSDRHPLGWNLFHKAWEKAVIAIGL